MMLEKRRTKDLPNDVKYSELFISNTKIDILRLNIIAYICVYACICDDFLMPPEESDDTEEVMNERVAE